jgi:hypothetical protein
MKPTEHDIEAEGLPSASGFDADFRCLGKRALCAQLPKEEDTAIQRRGHKIHMALEESDLSALAKSDEVTASRIMYGEAKLVHEHDFEGAEVTFEQRVWDWDDATGDHTWSARVDTLHVKPRRVLVGDYKSGWSLPPPIDTNWQIRAEAALVADLFDADEAVAALIHPHHPDSLYEARVYTRDDLRDLLATVRHNVAAIQMPDQPRTPGSVQCQYCTAKRVCPEYKAYAAELEQSIADEIKDAGFTAILRRSPRARGAHVRGLKEMQKNIEALLAQYVALAETDGEAVEGYRLARRMIRSITDEVAALELARNEFGSEAVYDAVRMSLPDLEAALAKNNHMTLREAKERVQRALGPVLKFTKSKNFLEEGRSL